MNHSLAPGDVGTESSPNLLFPQIEFARQLPELLEDA